MKRDVVLLEGLASLDTLMEERCTAESWGRPASVPGVSWLSALAGGSLESQLLRQVFVHLP